jgi:hypothetical protein
MELPLVALGKPLGFAEKQVMGPLALAHYPEPQAMGMQTPSGSNASKELCRMCTETQIVHQTPTENDEKRWKHPGEFGKVAA